MAGAAGGEVGDLLAAGDAGDGDVGVGPGGFDGREEAVGAHGAGDVVVLGFEAKGAGHAAAAGIDEAGVVAGETQGLEGGLGPWAGLLMAVGVEQDFA